MFNQVQDQQFLEEIYYDEGVRIRVNFQREGLTRGRITYQRRALLDGKQEIIFNNNPKPYQIIKVNGSEHIQQNGTNLGQLSKKIRELNAIEEKQLQNNQQKQEIVFNLLDFERKSIYIGSLTEAKLDEISHGFGDITTVFQLLSKHIKRCCDLDKQIVTFQQDQVNYKFNILYKITAGLKTQSCLLSIILEKQNDKGTLKNELDRFNELAVLEKARKQNPETMKSPKPQECQNDSIILKQNAINPMEQEKLKSSIQYCQQQINGLQNQLNIQCNDNQRAQQQELIKQQIQQVRQSILQEIQKQFVDKLQNQINELKTESQKLQSLHQKQSPPVFSQIFQQQVNPPSKIPNINQTQQINSNTQAKGFQPPPTIIKPLQQVPDKNQELTEKFQRLSLQFTDLEGKLSQKIEADITLQVQNIKEQLNKLDEEYKSKMKQIEERILTLEQLNKGQQSNLVQFEAFKSVQQEIMMENIYMTPLYDAPLTELNIQIDDEDQEYSLGILEEGNLDHLDKKARTYLFEFPDGKLTRGDEDSIRFLPRQILKTDHFGIKVDRGQRKLIAILNGQEMPPIILKEDFGPFSFVLKSELSKEQLDLRDKD